MNLDVVEDIIEVQRHHRICRTAGFIYIEQPLSRGHMLGHLLFIDFGFDRLVPFINVDLSGCLDACFNKIFHDFVA